MDLIGRVLRFVFPRVRRVIEENQHLKEEHEALRGQLEIEKGHFARLFEENDRLKEQHEGLTAQLETEKGRVAAGSNRILKLNAKIEAIQLEREELYRQHNQLLERLYAPSSEGGGSDKGLESDGYCTTMEPADGPRLNVGCGRVKKPGYLNVDVDPTVSPDVLLTLDSPLPFVGASFDLVEAYHVIEHVYPWQALDLLKEFCRILKPGGKIVLECPNIEAACGWLVQNAKYGWDSQMGMWALYGDPNPRNHLFMHRWGYTAASLWEILQKAGFTSIRRQSPQTHVPRRDLRMVAVKTNDEEFSTASREQL